jgi:CheY-like chemotaxis protein
MNIGQPVEILLVEDNPDDVALTLHALRAHHLSNQVQVARDGEEALAFLFDPEKNGPHAPSGPRLILLDLKLPKLDGLEVLRQIKADPHTRSIPVVVLTTSREDRDIEICYALGANSYIVKPVDFEQFTSTVHTLGLYWLLLNQGLES